ncbi:hypothetical protein HanPSC8_Chr04g0145171 [Helianthus annuus]|nr:hypothetical protein HanPSC8_Chr04g0145171 [Helianthus annuus]
MDEYLQYMKTSRSHMNDVEDQAAKISVEEQMQITSIQTLTKEIDLVKAEIKRLKEDSDVLKNTKEYICLKILERQRKIALLENDSSTLSQTLELIQQERVNLSTNVEKRPPNSNFAPNQDYQQQPQTPKSTASKGYDWTPLVEKMMQEDFGEVMQSNQELIEGEKYDWSAQVTQANREPKGGEKYDWRAHLEEAKQGLEELKTALEELECSMGNYESKLSDMFCGSRRGGSGSYVDKSGETE